MERTEVDKGDVIEVKFSAEIYLLYLVIEKLYCNARSYGNVICHMITSLYWYLDGFFMGKTGGDLNDSYMVYVFGKDNKEVQK